MRRRLRIAAIFLLASLCPWIGCAAAPKQPELHTRVAAWRPAKQLPQEVVRSFALAGATVTGVWHRNGELLATLGLDESSPILRGMSDFYFGRYAQIHIEQVDGQSAVAVVTLINPPLPPQIPRTIAGLSP